MKHLLFTIKKVFVPNRAECFNKRVASINSPTIRFLFCLCLDPGWIHSVSIAILGFYNKREHRTKVIISERVSLSTCPPSSPPKWENEKCKATIIINWVTPLHSSPEPCGQNVIHILPSYSYRNCILPLHRYTIYSLPVDQHHHHLGQPATNHLLLIITASHRVLFWACLSWLATSTVWSVQESKLSFLPIVSVVPCQEGDRDDDGQCRTESENRNPFSRMLLLLLLWSGRSSEETQPRYY